MARTKPVAAATKKKPMRAGACTKRAFVDLKFVPAFAKHMNKVVIAATKSVKASGRGTITVQDVLGASKTVKTSKRFISQVTALRVLADMAKRLRSVEARPKDVVDNTVLSAGARAFVELKVIPHPPSTGVFRDVYTAVYKDDIAALECALKRLKATYPDFQEGIPCDYLCSLFRAGCTVDAIKVVMRHLEGFGAKELEYMVKRAVDERCMEGLLYLARMNPAAAYHAQRKVYEDLNAAHRVSGEGAHTDKNASLRMEFLAMACARIDHVVATHKSVQK